MLKFRDAREKFHKAIAAVDAFGCGTWVSATAADELSAILNELSAWFDRHYPRQAQTEEEG